MFVLNETASKTLELFLWFPSKCTGINKYILFCIISILISHQSCGHSGKHLSHNQEDCRHQSTQQKNPYHCIISHNVSVSSCLLFIYFLHLFTCFVFVEQLLGNQEIGFFITEDYLRFNGEQMPQKQH